MSSKGCTINSTARGPKLGEHFDDHTIGVPATAAWVEKSSLETASKFTLQHSGGGLDQVFLYGLCCEDHAALCSIDTLLMFAASFKASGTIPLRVAWFLENQIKSHRTVAKIWNKCESVRGIPKVT